MWNKVHGWRWSMWCLYILYSRADTPQIVFGHCEILPRIFGCNVDAKVKQYFISSLFFNRGHEDCISYPLSSFWEVDNVLLSSSSLMTIWISIFSTSLPTRRQPPIFLDFPNPANASHAFPPPNLSCYAIQRNATLKYETPRSYSQCHRKHTCCQWVYTASSKP